ncbi:MAG TPA: TCR/Tet family MFS transporter [Cyclobacteriaceae bacterium]|nr:TCR/Tet family MFS transporter [Cyclobacteriaceae bacterium]HMV09101.1 TCR/Tet family MFS transporter [Cyclobacteriaceae bacterium]HMV90658.1 TCR/Tet family MFS transporter [Cyclobacteriaceae bacterium]HMW99494.1 TCR/Tet family MFS transporter [Cyclobacteriaceae bacterium]HMX48717.1 TCR/Tet family MFS transporter [Cyclobacteriaceae bacterium]
MSNRTPALGFIFVTLLLDVIGFGIIIPVMPDLIIELSGRTGTREELLSFASQQGGLLVAAYAFVQFLCAPIVGGLSDKYGRRPVLLGSLFGFGIDYLFLAFAPSLGWLFLGRIIAGIMGASFTTAGAYIADISTPEKRAQNFGMIGAAFGLGFIIGPLMGGLLADFGTRTPFFVCAGITLLNWLFGFFILPESLKPENRRKFEWARANPVGTLLSLKRYPVISGLILSLAFIYVSAHAVQTNWAYFVKTKFGWGPAQIGWSLAVVGVAFAVIQGGLIRVIIPKLGQERSVYLGIGLYAIGFLLYGIAPQAWMIYPIIIIYCLGSIAGPALQGIMSSAIPPNEQGELQGGFTSLMSLAAIIGPILMNGTFAWFTGENAPVYFPGAAMILGAILTLISSLLARNTLKKHVIKTT